MNNEVNIPNPSIVTLFGTVWLWLTEALRKGSSGRMLTLRRQEVASNCNVVSQDGELAHPGHASRRRVCAVSHHGWAATTRFSGSKMIAFSSEGETDLSSIPADASDTGPVT